MHPINILTIHRRPARPLPNVDTDQIIPKQFLKRIERTGYGDFLFYDWRRIQEGPDAGQPHPTSSSTSTDHKGAKILIAGKNFGCGSSREHAAWALNRLRLPRRHRPQLRRHLLLQRRQERHGPLSASPKLTCKTLIAAHHRESRSTRSPSTSKPKPSPTTKASAPHFDIDPFRKYCLLNGLDDIGLTLRHRI